MNAHAHPFVATGTLVSTPIVKIIDRPCGWGKSSELIKSFERDKRYLVVLPTLDEINNRYLPETNRLYGEGFFKSPSIDEKSTKYEHIEQLLIDGENIITTHALFTDIVMLAKNGLLKDYDVIIDEVLDCVKQFTGRPKTKDWDEFYVGDGYATVCELTCRISPTEKWDSYVEDDTDALKMQIYKAARAGCLYLVNDSFWVWTLPEELFTRSRSVTVYTYMAEGTLMLPYLRKIGVHVEHDFDETENEKMKWRCRDLITLHDMGALSNVKLSDSKQNTYGFSSAEAKAVSGALSRLKQRKLQDVPVNEILITCKKRSWYRGGKGPKDIATPRAGPFAAQSKLFRDAKWIPNTTRGTNDYRHCTHLIYLYDQYPAAHVVNWLNLDDGYQDVAARYALAELIQWVFRSRIRDGKPITLYLPSGRMRKLFNDWRFG
ncbi:hypothetical protein IWQ48_004224 [Labrenzia sp. EL_13]|nr:hypothetical protein [Labrenzia sp. EL_13]